MSFHEEWINGPGNHLFYARFFSSPNRPRAVVLFLHGFMEHVGRYEAVFPAWAARDIAVFAFDQRGFGRTYFSRDGVNNALYGKTSGVDQVRDIEFFVKEMSCRFPDVPIFLMGFSMGGGRALHFVTRTSQPPAAETVKLLRGVIAYAPHVNQTHATPKWVRALAGVIESIAPYTTLNTNAKAETLSRNVVTNRAWEEDPLIKSQGTLRGLGDLLRDGEELLDQGWQNWPVDLPVTSPVASKQFHDLISSKDKTYTSFPDAFHELHNELDVRDKFHATCIAWIEAQINQT
ncbi:alpha beta-hydrolase [Gautieria morchelliformis]|nr:alpha beta-hydrolase [Gautieria morchelliformis]